MSTVDGHRVAWFDWELLTLEGDAVVGITRDYDDARDHDGSPVLFCSLDDIGVKSGDDSPSAIDHDWMLDVSDDDNGGPNLENEFVGWETPHFECI